MSNLTLWEIEAGIAELFDALEEADTPEARQACEQALAEYAAREVQKVDGIAALYRQFDVLAHEARAEAQRLTERARAFENRRERVKELAQTVMEANSLTRLEGRTSRLLLKGNGGLQPLEVTDPAAVPPECCKMIGWIREDAWRDILNLFEASEMGFAEGDYQLERVVDNDRVRRALKTCEACGGSGKTHEESLPPGHERDHVQALTSCSACGGSGQGGVPGARLGERGKHVEVR